ncbi:DUF2254 domain-containing protein [Modicisalibacter luteus]|uniref:DUF2254 domain-containing protein n=1 Tax=Modicisalibacter luteus TaxID=453962 RepID=A0ABV7M002_9GAMM|nr:DUF2254 domain-containing protein [Halomonas lutea]GHA93882.1 hypothetical protein GCM10007159_14440 [Halomonas lutea]
MIKLITWPVHVLNSFRQSIAYLTSLITLAYLALALLVVLLPVDSSILPGFLDFVNFDDPDTARTLLATLIAGMISLMVFSFSMVMSVLTQAGGNFSHKLVFGLVTERRHQQVLGHYLGTILYILVLLMVPVDGRTPDVWRSLAAYLGAGMVINCLALFVYFIHNASQSVQINAITQQLHESALRSMERLQARQRHNQWCYVGHRDISDNRCHYIHARQSGYIQRADLQELAQLAKAADCVIHFNFALGDFIVRGFPILKIESEQPPDDEWSEAVVCYLEYVEGESIQDLYVNGLTQLMEIAVKALSPGINDPGTARLCLHQITELLCERLKFQPCNTLADETGRDRVTWPEESLESLLYKLYTPILHYGRDDVSICLALLKSLKTLSLFADMRQRDLLQAHAQRVVDALSELAADPLDSQFILERLDGGTHRLALSKDPFK